jgi:Rrf2 family nitric oxide-sensitive transcriptional repressor
VKLIRKDTDYALGALAYMAKMDTTGPVSARELADVLSIPHGFLRKILRQLSLHGIVESQKGKGGGFLLSLAPETITAQQIIEIFEGPIRASDCIVKTSVCPQIGTCMIHDALEQVRVRLVNDLARITIAHLVGKQKQTKGEA